MEKHPVYSIYLTITIIKIPPQGILFIICHGPRFALVDPNNGKVHTGLPWSWIRSIG